MAALSYRIMTSDLSSDGQNESALRGSVLNVTPHTIRIMNPSSSTLGYYKVCIIVSLHDTASPGICCV